MLQTQTIYLPKPNCSLCVFGDILDLILALHSGGVFGRSFLLAIRIDVTNVSTGTFAVYTRFLC